MCGHVLYFAVSIYNAGMRAEEFVYEKLDKPKPPRLTESETLGQSMIEAGNDFGPGTNYGEIYRLQCNTLFKIPLTVQL